MTINEEFAAELLGPANTSITTGCDFIKAHGKTKDPLYIRNKKEVLDKAVANARKELLERFKAIIPTLKD